MGNVYVVCLDFFDHFSAVFAVFAVKEYQFLFRKVHGAACRQDQIKEGKVKPALIVAVPVGFVGAAESKEVVAKLPIPYIIVRGRKGGSTIAVAIFNSLLSMAEGKAYG